MADDERMTNQDEQQPETSEEALVEAGEESEDKEKQKFEKLKESVQVAVEEVGALRKKLTVTIPRETIDERLEEQYSELSREAVVPGFRKGRAPRRLLEKRFGGEVGETITSDLVGKGFLAAVEKAGLKVIGDPLIWCRPKKGHKAAGDAVEAAEKLMSVTEAFDNLELPSSGAMTFACEVEVRPEFELPNLEGIPVERPKVSITEEDVDRQVRRFAEMRGAWAPVPDGAVAKDDFVSCALKMTADGKVVKEVDTVVLAARPQRVEGIVFQDFAERMAGAKVGETRTLTGTVPDDSELAELRGRTAEIELTVKELQQWKVPELDDAFVQGMGFENLAEFRSFVRSDMERRLHDVMKQAMQGQVYRYLLENTKFDLPAGLSERQTKRVVARRMLEMYRQGASEAEVERKLDELKTTAREEAARALKISLIMEKIAEDLKPTVTEDEVNGAIAMIAQQQNRRFDRVRDDLIKNDGLDSLYVQIRDEKIVDHLLEQAKVTETEGPKSGAAGPGEAGEHQDAT